MTINRTAEISLTKASDADLRFFFDLSLENCWVNDRDAGDLRRHRADYDVSVNYDVSVMTQVIMLSYDPVIMLSYT